MKTLIFAMVLTMANASFGQQTNYKTPSWGQSIYQYFRPLSSNDPEFLKETREKLAVRCNEQILDLQMNAYILKNAKKDYYASIQTQHAHSTFNECRAKLEQFDRKIARLEASRK